MPDVGLFVIMLRLRITTRRLLARRFVGVLTLASMLVGTLGVPLPQIASKDTSQPFPCQSRVCGCMNATACWKSCCCHTNAQKLVWAKRHGVTPPNYVVAAAERESRTITAIAKACCAPDKAQPSAKSCCKAPTDEAPTADAPIAWVRIEDARRCQGQGELFLMFAQALATLPGPKLDLQPARIGVLTPTSIAADNWPADVAAPPPKAAV